MLYAMMLDALRVVFAAKESVALAFRDRGGCFLALPAGTASEQDAVVGCADNKVVSQGGL